MPRFIKKKGGAKRPTQTKEEKIAALITEKAHGLFDREPRSSVAAGKVEELVREILKVK